MIQPIPQVTPDDIERVVRRAFSAREYAEVMTILGGYEGTRVRLAALKMANASVQTLQACIELAKRDYRDVVAAAEYPAYCKMEWTQIRDLSADEQTRIIDDDWRQYEAWLKKPV